MTLKYLIIPDNIIKRFELNLKVKHLVSEMNERYSMTHHFVFQFFYFDSRLDSYF